jgi:hypothetical protein
MSASVSPYQDLQLERIGLNFNERCRDTFKVQEASSFAFVYNRQESLSSYWLFLVDSKDSMLKVYKLNITMSVCDTIHPDINEKDLSFHKFSSEIAVEQCELVAFDAINVSIFKEIHTYESDDAIYVFVDSDGRQCDAFVFNIANCQLLRKNVEYESKLFQYGTIITSVRPFWNNECQKVLALVQQHGESDIFLSLVELDLYQMQIKRFIHKYALRNQSRNLYTAILQDNGVGASIIVVSNEGVTHVSLDGTKLTTFKKEDLMSVTAMKTVNNSTRFISFKVIGLDNHIALIFANGKPFLYERNATRIVPIRTQDYVLRDLSVLNNQALLFNLRRSRLDFPKYYICYCGNSQKELMYRLDISYIYTITNCQSAQMSILNRDLYIHILKQSYFQNCHIISREKGAPVVPVHKIVIKNRIPKLLERMDSAGAIHLKELSFEEVKSFVEYIYTGITHSKEMENLILDTFQAKPYFWNANFAEFIGNEEDSDIQFNFTKSNQQFKEHGVLWGCASFFLRDMTESCINEEGALELNFDVIFEDVSQKVFEYARKWIHTRDNNLTELTPDDILELISVAGYFGLELLLYQCEEYLVQRFSEFSFATCLFIIDIANRYSLRKLYSMAFDLIAERAKNASINDKKRLKAAVGDSVYQELSIISQQVADLKNYKDTKIKAHEYYQILYEFIDVNSSQDPIKCTENIVDVLLDRDSFVFLGDAAPVYQAINLAAEKTYSKGAIWLKNKVLWTNELYLDIEFKLPEEIEIPVTSVVIQDICYSLLDIPAVEKQNQLFLLNFDSNNKDTVSLNLSLRGIKLFCISTEQRSSEKNMNICIRCTSDLVSVSLMGKELWNIKVTIGQGIPCIVGFMCNQGNSCHPSASLLRFRYMVN